MTGSLAWGMVWGLGGALGRSCTLVVQATLARKHACTGGFLTSSLSYISLEIMEGYFTRSSDEWVDPSCGKQALHDSVSRMCFFLY